MYQDSSSPRGIITRTDRKEVERSKERSDDNPLRSTKRSTRNHQLRGTTLKALESYTGDYQIEDNKDVLLPKIQGDWNIMQTFSPKNSAVNRTALKRSFLTEDRKQPFYIADELSQLK